MLGELGKHQVGCLRDYRHRLPPQRATRFWEEYGTHLGESFQRIGTGAVTVGPVVVSRYEYEGMLEFLKQVQSVDEHAIRTGSRSPLEISQVDDPAQSLVGVDDFGQLEFGVLLQRIRHISHKGEAKTFRLRALAGWSSGAAKHGQNERGD